MFFIFEIISAGDAVKGIVSIFFSGSTAWVDTQLGDSGHAESLSLITPRVVGREEVMLRPNKPIKDRIKTAKIRLAILSKENRDSFTFSDDLMAGTAFIQELFLGLWSVGHSILPEAGLSLVYDLLEPT